MAETYPVSLLKITKNFVVIVGLVLTGLSGAFATEMPLLRISTENNANHV